MQVTVIDRSSEPHRYAVDDFESLYIRLVDELKIDGLCGGCASCATCHVYVDATDLDNQEQPGEVEREVLEGLRFKRKNSRLLCQMSGSSGKEITLTLAEME